ncbi:hypothetical protein LTR28_011262 [Elasticomyces elasticus]|nr:hypothetical protein LTR28_011262 [Elasticomyces elasticus]
MAAHSSFEQQQQQQQQLNHGLPSITSLTNGLPPTQQHSPSQLSSTGPIRDSGTWPAPASKRSSMNNPNLHVSTLLNPDESPSRSSIPNTPLLARIPQHVNSTLPSLSQGFEASNQYRGPTDYHPSMDSRRSSVDSRMHNGFSNLLINHPASPYDSQNASQVSLAASLQQQRRPNGMPMSPLSARSSHRVQHPAPRIAPPIMPVSRNVPGAPNPRAAEPTQGFPWAFPDGPIPEEARGGSSSDESSANNSISRQGSFAASSIRSSIFSTDSHLPPGQRRFEDEPATTHHHSMQHRTIASLQNDAMPLGSGGNYSRTPELRISHKLAERKRRSEMKDLFEELNKAVPSNGGAKASKWEILTKAIEYIRNNQAVERHLNSEINRLRSDAEYAREAHKEISSLRTEVAVMHQHLRRLDPNSPHVYGHMTSQLSQQQTQSNGPTPAQIALPPLHAAPIPAQYGAVAMQGVEYGRSNGYEHR